MCAPGLTDWIPQGAFCLGALRFDSYSIISSQNLAVTLEAAGRLKEDANL